MISKPKIAGLQKILLFLLIALLPVQLGRHFYFDFTRISAITIDYFIPTLYLTDAVIIILILSDLIPTILGKNKKNRKIKSSGIYILFFLYLLISVLLVSPNTPVSGYKLLKIIEFSYLLKICRDIRFGRKFFLNAYILALIYSGILAIIQFNLQRSAGGFWYYLGERTFTSSSLGIALSSWGGKLLLRPYATFAHPNVLAGFLASGLPLVLFQIISSKKINLGEIVFLCAGFILGSVSLILAFSRAAMLVFLLGILFIFILNKSQLRKSLIHSKRLMMQIFLMLFILSVVMPILVNNISGELAGSLFERRSLLESSVQLLINNPVFGTGLNNSIIEQYKLLPKRYGLFIFQPVHNSFLLALTELGLIGFIFIVYFIKLTIDRINEDNIYNFLPFFLIIVLGFFDHYPVTLQQGMLMTILFAGLTFEGLRK